MKNEDQELIKQIINDLTADLKASEPIALLRSSKILKREIGPNTLYGKFGGKGNDYINSVSMQFPDSTDFIAHWMHGLNEKVKYNLAIGDKFDPLGGVASFENVALLRDPVILDHVIKFLTRIFYRKIAEKTRKKPDEALWRIWFGDNFATHGLIIAPRFNNGEWINDKSEIRKVQYHYWTVGHAISSGFVLPSNPNIIKILNLDDLILFYHKLADLSNPFYERKIIYKYIDYLLKSQDPTNEPLLIPELRYGGLEFKHRFRMDFTVLNPYTFQHHGFEISPSSSHMRVTVESKERKEIDAQLRNDWQKESDKRTEYLEKFNIVCTTFTDNDLKDIDSCFQKIAKHLTARGISRISIEDELGKFARY